MINVQQNNKSVASGTRSKNDVVNPVPLIEVEGNPSFHNIRIAVKCRGTHTE